MAMVRSATAAGQTLAAHILPWRPVHLYAGAPRVSSVE